MSEIGLSVNEKLRMLNDYLSRFSYKPGWTFDIRKYSDSENLYLVATSLEPDADDYRLNLPHDRLRKIPISASQYLMREDQDGVISALRELIERKENHERKEWLRFDGNFVEDPHPELSRFYQMNTLTNGRSSLRGLNPPIEPMEYESKMFPPLVENLIKEFNDNKIKTLATWQELENLTEEEKSTKIKVPVWPTPSWRDRGGGKPR